jgi:hypothetical protein
MTTTSAREDRATDPGATAGPAATFTPPPKLRRRPALLAGGVAAVCLGALIAVWAWTSTTHTEQVLAARATIHRGQIITADDIERVRISSDHTLTPLPASAHDSVIGKRAALDIAAGSLLTSQAANGEALPPRGKSVVGISLTAAQAPAVPLQGGDQVRIVLTPGQDGSAPTGAPQFTTAQVVDTQVDDSTGNTVVDVLVPYADAGVLASRAATGNIALVLDAQPVP